MKVNEYLEAVNHVCDLEDQGIYLDAFIYPTGNPPELYPHKWVCPVCLMEESYAAGNIALVYRLSKHLDAEHPKWKTEIDSEM